MSGYPSDPGPPDEGARPYGSMPPPSAGEAFAARPEPPQQVQRAATILYITAAWSVLGLLIAFFTRDSTEDALRDASPTLTDAQISAAAGFGLVIAGVFAIGFGFLYYLCGRKMLEGRNWARIVPTVLIGIGLLFGLISISTGTMGGVSSIAQIISVVLGVAFLFFAWSRASSEFFQAARRPR